MLNGRSSPTVRNRVFLLLRKEARNAAHALQGEAAAHAAESSPADDKTLEGEAPPMGIAPPKTAHRVEADDFLSLFFVGL
jgi:hypothetical protein